MLQLLVAGALIAGALTAGEASASRSAASPIIVGYAIAKTGGFSTYDLELETGGKIAAAALYA